MVEKLVKGLVEAKKHNGKPIGKLREAKLISNARTLEKLAGEPLEKVVGSMEKTEKLADKIADSQYRAWTKSDYRTLLKQLWKIANNYDLDDAPKEIRWLKTGVPKRDKSSPKNLMTQDEIVAMMKHANPKQAAMIAVLFDAGLRVSELIAMKKSDVEFIKDGVRLHVPAGTKTGARDILAVDCAPHLAKWLSVHTIPGDNAPLFPSEPWARHYGTFTSAGVNKLLKEVARKAGIKKRIHPHLFRHSAATRMAKHLTESALKAYFGWVGDSDMAAVYVHLSGRDVDGQVLAMHGKSQPKEKEEDKLAPLNCDRCGRTLAHDAKLCDKCGWPTDANKAKMADLELQAKIKRFDEMEARLARLEADKAEVSIDEAIETAKKKKR